MQQILDKDKRLSELFNECFSGFSDSQLFQVYDLEQEKFITFPGPEGNRVMNKKSIIKGFLLSEMSNISTYSLIVLLNEDAVMANFKDPVFVGSDHVDQLGYSDLNTDTTDASTQTISWTLQQNE